MKLPPILQSKNLPEWANWVAQDQDGTWWLYEVEPNQHSKGWYENEIGLHQRIGKSDPNEDWQLAIYPLKNVSEN